jgi:hypothetical protein
MVRVSFFNNVKLIFLDTFLTLLVTALVREISACLRPREVISRPADLLRFGVVFPDKKLVSIMSHITLM